MIEQIHEIDKNIKAHIKKLKQDADKLLFEEVCEFKLNKDHVKEIPWGALNYPGIYLLEIKNNYKYQDFISWLDEFRSKWENEKYLKCFTPNIKKKRINRHPELFEWIPIYIGKSKKIEGRIHEHLFKELHKTTFALKLNSRDNLFSEKFRLKTIKCDVEHYNVIIPLIESVQRDKINPIIGRQ